MARRTSRHLLWAVALGLSTIATGSTSTSGQQPPADGPVQMTREEDHARTMRLLGLTAMPRGATGASVDTYDESKATPYPTLPDPLVMKSGKKVTSAAMWRARRAEILEDFEREVYGRRPKNTPKVTWEVKSTTNSMNGDVPIVTKELVGHVDNSAYPQITVDVQLTLITPANPKGPVPVIMQFGGGVGPGRGVAGRGAPPAGAPAPAPSGPTWQQQVLARGWGYAQIVPSSIQADNGGGLTAGIIGLVNK